jgi:hypothetical protein
VVELRTFPPVKSWEPTPLDGVKPRLRGTNFMDYSIDSGNVEPREYPVRVIRLEPTERAAISGGTVGLSYSHIWLEDDESKEIY